MFEVAEVLEVLLVSFVNCCLEIINVRTSRPRVMRGLRVLLEKTVGRYFVAGLADIKKFAVNVIKFFFLVLAINEALSEQNRTWLRLTSNLRRKE